MIFLPVVAYVKVCDAFVHSAFSWQLYYEYSPALKKIIIKKKALLSEKARDSVV